MSLNDIAKSLSAKKEEKTAPHDNFLTDLTDFIKFDSNRSGKPNPTVKPSMIGGCLRRVFFCVTEAEVDPDSGVSTEVVGMGESGTDRHERLQNHIIKMCDKKNSEWEWVDVAEYIQSELIEETIGTTVVRKQGNETKLYNPNYNLSFLCDGLIKNKETGEHHILEIKTETSFKYNKHADVYEEHTFQAKAYFLGLGVPHIIFLYENRDVCTKKTYACDFDENDKEEIINRIQYVDNFVSAKETPPMTKYVDKVLINKSYDCKYCQYKQECEKWGE